MTIKVGVLGAGQLGLMLGQAGLPLEIHCVFLDPNPLSPARLIGKHLCENFCSPAVDILAEEVELLTFEFENIPAEVISCSRNDRSLYPPLLALKVSQDRLAEKTLFNDLEIPTNNFAPVESVEDLLEVFPSFSGSAMLKTRCLGYDGRGQLRINSLDEETLAAARTLVMDGAILEAFVSFDSEVSCIGVFSSTESRFYPLNVNTHEHGILRHTKPTANDPLYVKASEYTERIAKKLNYKGVLTVEFFVKDDELLANEIAPRVHNSGHWTIEGAHCSQFENHLRAICDLPLGSTEMVNEHVEMFNIIGSNPNKRRLLQIPGLHLHLYGKEPKPNRKLGHATITGEYTAPIRDLTS
jgi:5-(carboxyamino)imidazole ribonucleotide synthase